MINPVEGPFGPNFGIYLFAMIELAEGTLIFYPLVCGLTVFSGSYD